MGLNFLASSSSFDCECNTQQSKQVNPDPNNYTIIRNANCGNFLAIEIKYHDCTNYEGRKILVFNCRIADIINQQKIDPHFSDNKKYYSPIARFEPTEQGWIDAKLYIKFKADTMSAQDGSNKQ